MQDHRYKIGKILLVISPILFALSLGFSCYYCEGESPDWSFGSDSGSGLLILMIGWIGLFEREFAWLANPFYLLTLTISLPGFNRQANADQSQSKGRMPSQNELAAAIGLSIVATALSLSFLLQSTTIGGPGPAGTPSRIIGYDPGYLLWVASLVLQSVGLGMCLLSRPLTSTQGDDPKP